jgi:hypothetical protein
MAYFADRTSITKKILAIINPEYTEADLHHAMITWWRNIRSTGGFGLTYAGSQAFEKAELEFQEFDNGVSSHMGNSGLSIGLDRKMITPYYFYSNEKRQKIKIYDSRIAMLVTLHESVGAYLKTLEERNK